MRQVRYRAVIALDPAAPRLRPALRPARARRGAPVPVPYPRSTAQTGPGAITDAPRDPGEAGERYFNHTRELMLRAESRERPGCYRSFAAELCWDDETPLRPGDRHIVTVTVTDDEAPVFFRPGQRFTLWSGADVGHGTISRRVFTEYGPC